MKKTHYVLGLLMIVLIVVIVTSCSMKNMNTSNVTTYSKIEENIVNNTDIETTKGTTEKTTTEITTIQAKVETIQIESTIVDTTEKISNTSHEEVITSSILYETTIITFLEETIPEATALETTEVIENVDLISEIRKTFWKTRTLNFEGEVFDEKEYPHFWHYGEYGLGYVVMYELSYQEPMFKDEVVADLTFHYLNNNEQLEFYYNGELYSLNDAYNQNMISLDDITRLNAQFIKYPYNKINDLQPGNYYLVPVLSQLENVIEDVATEAMVQTSTEENIFEETTKYTQTESVDIIEEIREAFWETRTLPSEGEILNKKEYPHFWYYGEYGVGHIVIIAPYMQLPMEHSEVVAGMTFYYYEFNEKSELYYNGEFYLLADAYDKGLISIDDLTRLHTYFVSHPYYKDKSIYY